MKRLNTIVLLLIPMVGAVAQEIHPQRVYPRFAIGVTGIYGTIEPGRVVTVQDTRSASPAAGKLQMGDG